MRAEGRWSGRSWCPRPPLLAGIIDRSPERDVERLRLRRDVAAAAAAVALGHQFQVAVAELLPLHLAALGPDAHPAGVDRPVAILQVGGLAGLQLELQRSGAILRRLRIPAGLVPGIDGLVLHLDL